MTAYERKKIEMAKNRQERNEKQMVEFFNKIKEIESNNQDQKTKFEEIEKCYSILKSLFMK